MSSLTSLEKRKFEDLFGMESGYVLDFTNRNFEELFRGVASINIYDEKYSQYGGSKAKRLRAFWDINSDLIVGKVLSELLSIWKYNNDNLEKKGNIKLCSECEKIVNRLLGKPSKKEITESEFLGKDFSKISVKKLEIEASIIPILESRITEANKCLRQESSLAVVFLTGSILEGVLLGTALSNPQKFNMSPVSPKDKSGKVKSFPEWTLSDFIDVACNIKLLSLDVKKFSHALREFRNYIHPYEQMTSGFNPDKHTAEICLQVLKAAIADLSGKR